MNGISVIIPIYNTEIYLKYCIESVLKQSVPFDKIILINDGSIDNSLNICRNYEAKHSNIIVLDQVNQGAGATRNRGLEYITSKYVMFLDSDDYLKTNSVEIILSEMEREELDILYFDSEIKNELDVYKRNNYNRAGRVDERVISGKEYFIKNYPSTYIVSPCMVTFNKEFLKKHNIEFPNEAIYEDVYFTFKSIIKAKRVKYISEKLYIRRYRPNSIMTQKWTNRECDDIYSVFKKCWELIKELIALSDTDFLDSLKIFLIHSYFNIKKCVEKFILGKTKQLIYLEVVDKEFIETWNEFKKESLDSNESLYVLAAIYRLINNVPETGEIYNYFELRNNCKQLYVNKLKELLINLPFNKENTNVGIYGVGEHTKRLILWYEKIIGDIKCNLYYIDTYKKTFEEKYKGKPIINISDANQYVDIIVISSIYYDKIMLDTISKLYSSSISVISFYNERNYDLLV